MPRCGSCSTGIEPRAQSFPGQNKGLCIKESRNSCVSMVMAQYTEIKLFIISGLNELLNELNGDQLIMHNGYQSGCVFPVVR